MQLSISPARNNIQNTPNKQQNFKGLYFANKRVQSAATQHKYFRRLIQLPEISETIQKHNVFILQTLWDKLTGKFSYRACSKIKRTSKGYCEDGLKGPIIPIANTDFAKKFTKPCYWQMGFFKDRPYVYLTNAFNRFMENEPLLKNLLFKNKKTEKAFWAHPHTALLLDNTSFMDGLRRYQVLVTSGNPPKFQITTDVKQNALGNCVADGIYTRPLKHDECKQTSECAIIDEAIKYV